MASEGLIDLWVAEAPNAIWRAELQARHPASASNGRVIDLRDGRDRSPSRLRFSYRRLPALIALVVLIVVVSDLAYVGIGLRSHLFSAGSSLRRGREAVTVANLDKARREFKSAMNAARGAAGLKGNPALQAARSLPWISSDARAVALIASNVELAARAGLDLINLYERLGVTGTGLAGALFEDGQVRLDSVPLATRAVSRLIGLMSHAASSANEDVESHFQSLNDALDRIREDSLEALQTLRRAETLLVAAPGLFGEEANRRYLLVVQNPAQSRASGGVIDYYGLLSADDGKFQLGRVLPIATLEGAAGGKAWSRINRSVDFPSVASAILARYEDVTGRRLDGVVSVDSIALEYMANATGPVRAQGLDLAVGSDNAAQVLMHDVFDDFGERTAERDRYVARIIEKIWYSVTKGAGSSSVLLDALTRAADEQHLKVYAAKASSERAMEDLEVSGDPALLGPGVQTIAQNNRSMSRVDFYLRRQIDTRIELGADGSATVTFEVRIENRAPDGPSSVVLGFGRRPGTAPLSLEMLLPRGAGKIEVGGDRVELADGAGRRPLVVSRVTVPPGETADVVVGYKLPPGDVEGAPGLELVLLPAPLAFPDEASVRVGAPEGFCINSCDDATPRRWDLARTLSAPLTVRARLVKAGS